MSPFTVILVLTLLGNIIDTASGFSLLPPAVLSSPSSSHSHTSSHRHKRLYDVNHNLIERVTSDDDGDEGEADITSLPITTDTDDCKMIFLVSDGTGSSVKASVQKSLGQFDVNASVQTRLFTFVRGEEIAASIIKKAKERSAMLITTIRVRALREKVLRMCELSGVHAVDLIGPTLDGLESHLQQLPENVPTMFSPNKVRVLSNAYYRRIDALQFTLKADDGQAPWLLSEADVILVGVSRSGKTPLSVVLSQSTGLKVANIPLVLECPPPKELLDEQTIDSNRVFCLTLSPSELKKIRATRLESRLGVKAMEEKMEDKNSLVMSVGNGGSKSNYADRPYILKDLKNAFDLKERYGWTQIDVTGRAVEDTASQISELISERFDSEFETRSEKSDGVSISLH